MRCTSNSDPSPITWILALLLRREAARESLLRLSSSFGLNDRPNENIFAVTRFSRKLTRPSCRQRIKTNVVLFVGYSAVSRATILPTAKLSNI